MRAQAFWKLLFLNMRRNARNLILSSLGIVVGTGSFIFFVSLGFGVKNIVAEDLLGVLPINQIEIVPKHFNLGLFQVSQSSFFKNNTLNERTLQRLRSLPEVKAVYGKMNMKAPAFAIIPIPREFRKRGMASAFYTELVVQGIDPRAIDKKDFLAGKFEYVKGKTIPVLISRRLLDLYNATLADLQGFPKLTAKVVSLVRFNLKTGRSAFRRRDHPRGVRSFKSHVIGVSKRAILIGVTVPLNFVKYINKIYNPNKPLLYQSAIIEAHNATDMPKLLKKIKAMGFTLESSQIFARKIGESIIFITLLLTLISAVIMIISAISISHAFFMFIHERRFQIGLMRAIGATRSTIRNLLMMEAAFAGMLSGLVGFGLTYAVIAALRHFLPLWHSLPFSPEKLFFFPPWLPLLAIAFAPIFCLLGAFFPALRAASLDPARVLSES